MKRVHQIGIEGILFGCDSPIPGNSPREFLERWRKKGFKGSNPASRRI
jgi:hypothetical protein